MEKIFEIKGMTCRNCIARVKAKIEEIPLVENAAVQLEYPQATIKVDKEFDVTSFPKSFGKYTFNEVIQSTPFAKEEFELAPINLNTYKPLVIIIAFIFGTCLLVQYPFAEFSWMIFMRHFMAGFFLVFSFFKFLNLNGFAQSYAMYDIIASKFNLWGYVYPFIELILGVLYLINFNPILTNIFTLIILGVGTVGVVKSNLNQQQIKCACLGDVFNLPMSTVTIIENVSMLLMAGGMLYYLSH